MSFRLLPTGTEALSSMLRDFSDRLERIERGGLNAGRVSFGPVIQIGDVEIEIVDGAGTHRTIRFKNLLSGATSTIVL